METSPVPSIIRVFISYSHDSLEHMDRVLSLSDRLRQEGIDAALDQYETSPPEGWPVWMERQVRESDFVLVVCTETYLKRAERREQSGKGHGATWESTLNYQQIYDAGSTNIRFVPILFDTNDRQFIPIPLKPATSYVVTNPDDYEDLYRRLTNQPRVTKPELGRLQPLPARRRKPSPGPPEPSRRAAEQNLPDESTREEPISSALWNVPYERNPVFTGRSELLEMLRSDLHQNGRQALFGLGGIGKTQVAAEYAYRFRSEYNAVFWAFADSAQSISTDFIEVAHLLKLPVRDMPEQDVIVAAVARWLEENDGWLLIFDDVNPDHPEISRKFLPQGRRGHVLLTSRGDDFQTHSIFKPREVTELPPEAAREFLLKRTGRELGAEDVSHVDSLANVLGLFPLALEQAGAFISENRTSFESYFKSFCTRRLKLLEQHRPVLGAYKDTVATTWAINFAEVEKLPASADLLRVSAFLSSAPIPLELLQRGKADLGDAIGQKIEDVDRDPVLLDELLKPPADYSLIRRNPTTRSYTIHPLVQEVVRENLPPDRHQVWAECAVNAMSHAFPEGEFKNWAQCERLLSHASVCIGHIERYSYESAASARLLHNTGVYLHQRAQFSQAAKLLKRALDIREKVIGCQHPDTADTLTAMGSLCGDRDDYRNAERLLEQALAITQSVFGPDHQQTSIILNELGSFYSHRGKYKEAEELLQRALRIEEKLLGADHPDTAATLDTLATSYFEQSRYAESERAAQRALQIREASLGNTHRDTGISLTRISDLHELQRDHAEAERLARRALAIVEKNMGPDHPYTATALDRLANLTAVQNRPDEAEALFKRSLKINEQAYGAGHSSVGAVFHNLGVFYRSQGRKEEAETLLKRSLEIAEKAFGTEHPELATSMKSLANLYVDQGKYKLAEPLLLRTLAIRERILGPENFETQATLKSVVFLYRQWGKVREANKYEKRLRIVTRKRR